MHNPVLFHILTRWMCSRCPSSPWWCGTGFMHPSVFFMFTYLVNSKRDRAASFCGSIQVTHLFLFFSYIFTQCYVLLLRAMRWAWIIHLSSIWWCGTRCLHQSVVIVCTYLAHGKSNGAASIFVTLQLTRFILFFLLCLHCFFNW